MSIPHALGRVVEHGKVFHVRVRQIVTEADGMDIDVAITLSGQQFLIGIPRSLIIVLVSIIGTRSRRTTVRQEIRDIARSVFNTIAKLIKPGGRLGKGRAIVCNGGTINICPVYVIHEASAESLERGIASAFIGICCCTCHLGNRYFDRIGCVFSKGNDCDSHAAVGKVRVSFNARNEVLNALFSRFKSVQPTVRTIASNPVVRHAGGHIQNEAGIVVGRHLLAFDHAAGIASGHGAGNAVTAVDDDGIVAVIDLDGGIETRRMVHHFQRHFHRGAGNITVGVFGLEDKLELVGRLPLFTGNTELFVLFHGPAAVLIQRGGEELLAVRQRAGQDGFAGSAFAERQRHIRLLAIHQNRDDAGSAVCTEGAFIHHAGEVEAGMDVRIGVGETVRTGLSRHLAFIDDDGVVALGDEVDALNGEVTVFIRELGCTVIHGGDDHLVKTAQHNIRRIEGELAVRRIAFHHGAAHDLAVTVEGDQRLFGHMVPLRRACRPRFAVVERAEVDGHAVGQLTAKVEHHGFTSFTILGNIDFPCLSITRTADHEAPIR